jgi:hypothetical protein
MTMFLRLFQREKGKIKIQNKRGKQKENMKKKRLYDFFIFFDKLLNRVVRYLNNFEL